MNLPPVPTNLARAASWSWRVLVCGAAVLAVLGVLWYVRVIVLPVLLALTITPALSPIVRFSEGDSGAPPPQSPSSSDSRSWRG